jgi:hypothetical protein
MQLATTLQRNHAEREVIAFVLFVTSYIWAWQRAFHGALWVVIGGALMFIAVSNILHRDSARSLGLRMDNLTRSLIEVSVVTVIIFVILIASGWLLGTLRQVEWWKVQSAGWHYFWAFVQQYALQAFVLTRLREVYHREHSAALAAAGWFAFLHLPNPPLTIMTFVVGYVWCRLFQRQPNLFTLALSHTILAIVTVHSFPRAWLHSMKVGPGYFNF